MSETQTAGKGPVTNCINCDKWVAGTGPQLCEECSEKGFRICAYCNERVANETTPYCNQCAEEVVGAG